MKGEVERLTRRLVAIESPSPPRPRQTSGEQEVVDALADYLKDFDGVEILSAPGERWAGLAEVDPGRRNLYARVRGNGRECLLLSGHVDTVSIDEYGNRFGNREIGLDPERLAERLPDYAAEGFIMGRGALDMKSGLACCAVILSRLASSRDHMNGEVLFVAVCDEENASAGILKAAEFLYEYQDEVGVKYLGLINTDYTKPLYSDDGDAYFGYRGTIGKVLPAFLVTGCMSHAGEPFFGFPANLLASEVNRRIEMNVELCERSDDGEATPPPVALKVEDLKGRYDVQTPQQVHLYYNFFTFEKGPREVLESMKKVAVEAAESVVERIQEQYQAYREVAADAHEEKTWEPRVMTLSEVCERLRRFEKEPERLIGQALDSYWGSAREAGDPRIACREVVRELWDALLREESSGRGKSSKEPSDQRQPGIVVYLAPPYYPGFASEEQEPGFLDAVETLAEEGLGEGAALKLRRYYPYISDMSYVSLSRSLRENLAQLETTLAENMPVWRRGGKDAYEIDLEKIAALEIPVVDFGPAGFGAHTHEERAEKEYTFGTLPRLLETLVHRLVGLSPRPTRGRS